MSLDTCECGHPRDGHEDSTGRCECGWLDLMRPNSVELCKCRSFRSKG